MYAEHAKIDTPVGDVLLKLQSCAVNSSWANLKYACGIRIPLLLLKAREDLMSY